MRYAEQLARLRVATATGRLPPDLGQWLIEVIEELVPSRERTRSRDALLRKAAEFFEGSAWRRAILLSRAIATRGRCETPASARPLVRAALELDGRCPRSPRQLYRLLAGH